VELWLGDDPSPCRIIVRRIKACVRQMKIPVCYGGRVGLLQMIGYFCHIFGERLSMGGVHIVDGEHTKPQTTIWYVGELILVAILTKG